MAYQDKQQFIFKSNTNSQTQSPDQPPVVVEKQGVLLNSNTIQYIPNSKLKISFYEDEIALIRNYQKNKNKDTQVATAHTADISAAAKKQSDQINKNEIASRQKQTPHSNEVFELWREKQWEFTLPDFTPQIIDSTNHFAQNTTGDFSNRKVFVENDALKETEVNIDFKFSQKDWVFWYVIGIVALFVVVRLAFKKVLFETIRSVINKNSALRLSQENNQVAIRASVILKTIFVLTMGLFTFQTLDNFTSLPSDFTHFQITLLCSLGWGILYTLKYIFTSFIGFLTNTQENIQLYLSNTAILNKVLGLLLLPIVFSVPYLKINFLEPKDLLLMGWVFFLAFYLLRLTKGVLICIRQNVSLFYLILYLCTLELIPSLLLLKVLDLV